MLGCIDVCRGEPHRLAIRAEERFFIIQSECRLRSLGVLLPAERDRDFTIVFGFEEKDRVLLPGVQQRADRVISATREAADERRLFLVIFLDNGLCDDLPRRLDLRMKSSGGQNDEQDDELQWARCGCGKCHFNRDAGRVRVQRTRPGDFVARRVLSGFARGAAFSTSSWAWLPPSLFPSV